MTAAEVALYARLTAVLSGGPPAGGIHSHPSPQSGAFPVVTFQWQAEPAPKRVIGGGSVAWDTLVYFIRAICTGHDKTPAAALSETIRAGLDNHALAVAGRTTMNLQYVGGIQFSESVGGETYHHVGGLYELQVA